MTTNLTHTDDILSHSPFLLFMTKSNIYNPPMKIVIQLIENYLKQQIPTVLISTDNHKYLINVPAGFQRFTKEHRIRLPVGAHYFFTKSTTATISGLTGLLLTLFERGASCNSKLYLDDRFYQYMEELRYKVGMKILPISYCSWGGNLRRGWNNFDGILQAGYGDNFPHTFAHFQQFLDTVERKEVNDASLHYNSQTQVFENQDFKIFPFHVSCRGETMTNYIFEPPKVPGNMKPQKLKEFGLSGKIVGELTRKGTVEHKGRVVTLDQVKSSDEPSPHFLILHYNCPESVEAVTANPRFQQYISQPHLTDCIIHIAQTPEIVLSNHFRHFINQWPENVSHYVYNKHFRNSSDPIDQFSYLSKQAAITTHISKQFPMCMPNLQQINAQYLKNFIAKMVSLDQMFPERKVTAYRKCHEVVVLPKKRRGYFQVQGDKKESAMNQVEFSPVEVQIDPQIAAQVAQIDPKVVFLGTGSMKPSKYRNVSSIMVELSPESMIMFDCGEGSHIQIADHYGYEKYEQTLLALQIVFITHIHSDHNLGILDVISQRNAILRRRGANLKENRLFLVLPANVVPWFNTFCESVEDLREGCEVVFIQSLRGEAFNFEGTMSKEAAFNKNCPMIDESQNEQVSQENDQLLIVVLPFLTQKPQWGEVLRSYSQQQPSTLHSFQQLLKLMGLVQFEPVPVVHCPQAHGIVIRHVSGVKISYTGDTRPCSDFCEAAHGSTMMIHEATYGDDLSNQAAAHMHSTVGEAIDIGMKGQCYKTLLTHFSQRYRSASEIVEPKLYKLCKEKQEYAEKHTIVCFDHLEVALSQAHLLPYYTRSISSAFPSETKQ